MGSLLTLNTFVLSSENRVKKKISYHIYLLNWKLGNSSEKKSFLSPTELKICGVEGYK